MNTRPLGTRHRRGFGVLSGAMMVALLAGGIASPPAHAQCNSDLQGSDDQPGQKDLSEFCNLGTCGGSNRSMAFNFDDLAWSGNNTGDGCFLFDTNGDGLVNFAVCATLSGQTVLSGPSCYQCNDSRPDRCQNNAPQVACSSLCTLNTAVADPFAGDPAHTANKCNGTNCRLVDARVTCCLTAGDTGGGALIDACSYPSQNPGSDPSDCIVTRQCNANADCNDNNPCTVDSCNPDHVCLHVAGNAGALCRTAAGVCDAAEFCSGTSITCPADGFLPNTTVCRPAQGVCDVAESCTGSSADCPADQAAGAGTLCRAANGQCDLAEVCDGVSSDCPADGSKANGTPCTDNNACTDGDTCQGGVCTPGPDLNCNDSNICTDDSCNPASGCVHVDNEDPCSDGSACTDGDTCSNGSCVPGPTLDCNDNNVCTTDGCNPATGCTHANHSNPCDDGDACTVNDACSGGSCVGGPPTNCDDGDACTADSCVHPTGCEHTGIVGCCNTDAQCADTDQCTTNERCVNHTCESDPVVCNDNNVCTDDSCNPASGCVYVNNNDPCSDGSACTDGDACSNGSCVGGPPVVCVDSNPCTDDGCNPASGCFHDNNSDPCDDGNACTTGDQCSGGGCAPGGPTVCNDGNPCTDDDCNPVSGCFTTFNTDPCSDGDGCTENDACSNGDCAPGTPKSCTDQNVCTDDTCVSPAGTCAHVNNAEPCSDGDNCTEDDVCTNGSCVPGSPKDCNDHLFCTVDTCHSPDGQCEHSPNGAILDCCDFDADCADSDFCTENERCVNNLCESDPVDCNDNDPCTVDHCDNAGGGFLCMHDNCLELDGEPCGDPSCFPPRCGDGVVNAPGETCDPPDATVIPGTNPPQVVCRANCTFCGDGNLNVGETCDDGNQVSGCNPQFPQRPLDSCTNSCAPPVCDDPSKIKFSELIDKIDAHGRLVSPGTVDFASRMFVFQLVDSNGDVVFRASLHAGDLAATPAGTVFKYKNKLAKTQGGAYSVKVKRVKDTYRATASAYGNLYNAEGNMLTQFFSGSDSWVVEGFWERTTKGWRFVQ